MLRLLYWLGFLLLLSCSGCRTSPRPVGKMELTPEKLQVSPTSTMLSTRTSKTLITPTISPTLDPQTAESLAKFDEEINYNKMQGNLIIHALEVYFDDNGQYPEEVSDLIPKYLEKIPLTKSGDELEYWISEYCSYGILFYFPGQEKKHGSGGCMYCQQEFSWECSKGTPP